MATYFQSTVPQLFDNLKEKFKPRIDDLVLRPNSEEELLNYQYRLLGVLQGMN